MNIERTNVDLGVKVPLKTGGTINVNLADDKFKTDNIFATLNPSYSSDGVSLNKSAAFARGRQKSQYVRDKGG